MFQLLVTNIVSLTDLKYDLENCKLYTPNRFSHKCTMSSTAGKDLVNWRKPKPLPG